MKKSIIFMLVLGCLTACDGNETVSQKNAYSCGNYNVEMEFSDDGAIMHAIISGDAVDLALTQSASGAKYSGFLNDTNVVLWGKGNAWTMFLGPDETIIECSIK